MKRILGVVLAAIILCFAFFATSCGEIPADELVNGALEKTRVLGTYEAEIVFDISVAAQGVKLEIPVNLNIEAKNADTESAVTLTTITAEALGSALYMEMYTENGWIYTVSPYGNSKNFMGVTGLDGDDSVDSMLANIPDELADKCIAEKIQGGRTAVRLTIPPEMFEKMYGDAIGGELLSGFFGSILGENALSTENIEEVELLYVVGNNGYIIKAETIIKLNSYMWGMESEFNINISTNFIKYGGDIKITPPQGYLEFPDEV